MDKHLFCIIHNELPICSGMVGWETWYPRRGLKLPRLVSSCMVLIQQAGLGRYMMRAKWWACASAGPIKQWVQAQRQWYSQCPPFLWLKDYALLVEEKYCVLRPQVWRVVDY